MGADEILLKMLNEKSNERNKMIAHLILTSNLKLDNNLKKCLEIALGGIEYNKENLAKELNISKTALKQIIKNLIKKKEIYLLTNKGITFICLS